MLVGGKDTIFPRNFQGFWEKCRDDDDEKISVSFRGTCINLCLGINVSKSKQEELDNYDTMLSDLFFLSGFKGTTFFNPPFFRGINLQKIFKVDNKSPFTEC
ncbi:hypothetical protein, partial [Segatella hominis]|uniref:hypothetical protein n=1 Tax=Segatella hominis TaxID=2518605 RepID=UPI003F7EF151